MEKKEFEDWFKLKKEAQNVINGREEKVAEVDERIEKELELVGTTAIEDKL